MDINLDETNILKYKLTDLDKVKMVNLIVSFSNNVEYKFTGKIDVDENEIIIELPKLNTMIKNEIEAECYLEIIRESGEYYKSPKEAVKFYHKEKTEIDTEFPKKTGEISTYLINDRKASLEIDMKKIVTKKTYGKKVGVRI